MITIGSARIGTNIFLAPLSGCSDLAFRLIAREHGAKFCFFEMIDSNSVIYGPERKLRAILETVGADKPIAVQILGEDPQVMLRASKRILEHVKVSFLDINAACPAKKVLKKKAGSYLVKNSSVLYEIVKKLASSLTVPVTVKIRLGLESCDLRHVQALARGLESNGACAIFVHGRTSSQGYSGEVNYTAIKTVKESVKIPVFGTGNIFNAKLAKKMFDDTGCDGIAVARGSLGNPWIFGEIEDYISCGRLNSEIDSAKRLDILKRHLSYIDSYRKAPPPGNVGYMRKIAIWYLKGFANAPRLRHQISVVTSYEKMLKLIDSI
jgi:tRNA-dihydrouridine synthase B